MADATEVCRFFSYGEGVNGEARRLTNDGGYSSWHL